jgi:hypothetical protein
MFSSSTNLVEHHSYGAIGIVYMHWSYTSCGFDDCYDVYSYAGIDIVYMHWLYASCRFNEHWDAFLSLVELGELGCFSPFWNLVIVEILWSKRVVLN